MDATDALGWKLEFPELETESSQTLTIEEMWEHLPKNHPNEAIWQEWHEDAPE